MARSLGQSVKFDFRSISQRGRFEVPPHVFNRIEFRSIRRKVFDRKPSCGSQHGSNDVSAMSIQPIPNNDGSAGEMPGQLVQEVPHKWCGDGDVRMKAEEEADATTSRGDNKSCDDGNLLMGTRPLMQDRRLAARRPAPTNQRSHQKAAFIDKHV